MSDPFHNQKQDEVTLEDLLKLKRSEKPAPEFWETFDRDLKEKTLAAIVEKPSKRKSFARGLWYAFRPVFPVASAALIALAFVNHFNVPTSENHSEALAFSDTPEHLSDLDSMEITHDQKHFVQNVISSQNSLSSQSIQYIAGNVSRAGIATAVKHNNLF